LDFHRKWKNAMERVERDLRGLPSPLNGKRSKRGNLCGKGQMANEWWWEEKQQPKRSEEKPEEAKRKPLLKPMPLATLY
jgi:hypothetical protein